MMLLQDNVPVDSVLGRELASYEQFHSHLTDARKGILPGNPYVYRAFPKMVYRGRKKTMGGGWEPADSRVAKDDGELAVLKGMGYVEGPDRAIVAAEQAELAAGVAEAELLYEQQHRLRSARAKAEVEAAIQADPAHITHVPETPVRRRGRPTTETPVSEE